MRTPAFACCFCLVAPGLAGAAEAPAAAEEIVVVAIGRRAEAFETPASVLRLDAETLRGRQIRSLDELAEAAPGLFLINDQDPGTNILSARGVTTDRLQAAAVAYLSDGVLLADTELFTAPLFDVGDAQVVRGPQGALFGKNAAGGVVALSSRRPGERLNGYLRALYGTGDRREFEGAIGGPVGGGLSLRAAGYWTDFEGVIANTFLDQRVDAEERRAARLIATFEQGPVALFGKVQWLEEDGGAAFLSSGDVTGDFGGRLGGAALTAPMGDFPGAADRRWLQGALSGALDLGGARASLTLARDRYDKDFIEELDFRAGPLTFFGAPLFPEGLQPIAQPVEIAASTLDFALEGEVGRLAWRANAFVQDVDRDRVDDFGPLLFGAPAPRFETDSLQTAGSLSLDWRVSERLRLSAAIRRDADRRSQTILADATGALIERREARFARFQPQAAAGYALSPDAQLYIAYGEAFRTGGFNPIPGPQAIFEAVFPEEVVRSLEGGLKLRNLPLQGRFEATLFAARTRNFQNYAFLDGNSVALQVDRVNTRGAELSAAFTPFEGLDVSGVFALADAEIGPFIAPDPVNLGALRDLTGNQVPNVPLWTTSFSLVYARALGAGWRLLARADANGVGRTRFEIDNVLFAPPRATADLRLELKRGRYALAGFVRNVTDERFAISAFGQTNIPLLAGLGPDGPFDSFTLNRGRQAAIEARLEF